MDLILIPYSSFNEALTPKVTVLEGRIFEWLRWNEDVTSGPQY